VGGILGSVLAFTLLSESSLRLGKSPGLVELRRFPLHEGDRARQLLYSADGSLLVCHTESSGLYVWDSASGERLWQGDASAREYHFAPSGTELACFVIRDKPAIVFLDDRTGEESRSVPLAGESVDLGATAFCWSPATLFGGCAEDKVHIWQAESGDVRATWSLPALADGFPNQAQALAFLGDGRQVLVAGRDGFYLCDANSGEVERRFPVEYNNSQRIMISADGQRAVAGGTRSEGASTIRVLNLASGDIALFEKHRWNSWAVDLSSDGSRAVSGGRSPSDADYIVVGGTEADYGCELIVWNPLDLAPIATSYAPESSITAVAISPSGTQIAAAERGAVVLYELLE
jgi:WD40 repeat protein